MESWHPAVSLAFFAVALVLTVVVQNPAFLAAAFCAAFGLLLTVRGARAWRTLGALLPLFAVVALANPLVNSQGATVLFLLPWGRPYTLEALLFGVQTAAMLATVLLWFFSFNVVMTGDRLGHLFGQAAPGTSLVLTMVLRLVPRFGRQVRKVSLAFDGLAGVATMRQDEDETPDGGMGAQKRPAGWRGRVRRGARELSALASWALEGSIDTADSMRSRGYGTGQRSRLAAYRVTPVQGVGWPAGGVPAGRRHGGHRLREDVRPAHPCCFPSASRRALLRRAAFVYAVSGTARPGQRCGKAPMEFLAFQNLTFTYPGADRPALDSVCLEVGEGGLLCLMGRSGSGKTTLLRQLKTPLAPRGTRSGHVRFLGDDIDTMDPRDQARLIGFVGQDPASQLVCDTVEAELAFGLENLGLQRRAMAMRVAETASYFGLQELMDWPVEELSGGQQQLVNLASVLAMRPRVLVLDEPTSQLDPLAASEFLSTVSAVNDDLGITVIMTEHRLETVFPLADQVAVMEAGRMVAQGTPQEVTAELRRDGNPLFGCLPSAARIAVEVEGSGVRACPLTVRAGRHWLEDYVGGKVIEMMASGANVEERLGVAEGVACEPIPEERREEAAAETREKPLHDVAPAASAKTEPALLLRGVWFRYGRDLPDVLRGADLTVGQGELFALVGANGTGKSTLLTVACGLRKSYRGSVRGPHGRWAMVPQDPVMLFSRDTVRQELADMEEGDGERTPRFRTKDLRLQGTLPNEGGSASPSVLLADVVRICALGELLDRHPLDLSSGEQQRLALAKALLRCPSLLLLDEPTKGLDGIFKDELGFLLRQLTQQGLTVVLVSHDVEFCARWATQAALLFEGRIAASGTPSQLFSQAAFYTTTASRIARGAFPGALTVEDVVRACRAL